MAEYKQAPEVTRTRLYLETMQEVMMAAPETIIIDSKAPGLMPLMDVGAPVAGAAVRKGVGQ